MSTEYNIELKVITPLAVGAGGENDWIEGMDFIRNDGKVYVLDMQKIARSLGKEQQETLVNSLRNQDSDGIKKLLADKLPQYAKYTFDQRTPSSNPIKTFCRSNLLDIPIVAGSSLKGAIRSALLWYIAEIGSANKDRYKDSKNVNEEYGSLNKGTDIMRFVQVSDIELKNTQLVNTKIFNLYKDDQNLWKGGWKHSGGKGSKTDGEFKPIGFNTLYECAMPEQKGFGRIVIRQAHALISNNIPLKKKQLLQSGIDLMFAQINEASRRYLRSELAFYKKYSTSRTEEIEQCLQRLLDMIPFDGKSCLIKMSAGVGFHSITGNWQYQDYINTGIDSKTNKVKYKSRKIACMDNMLLPMGFVMLRQLSETESQDAAVTVFQRHEKILSKINEEIERKRVIEEANRKKRIEDERKQREEKENREKYEDLINRAEKCIHMEDYKQAKAFAEQAQEILPQGQMHQNIIDSCDNEIKLRKCKEQKEERIRIGKEKRKQPLEDNLRDCSNAASSIRNITEKWIKEGNEFDTIACEAFVSKFQAFLETQKKDGQLPKKTIENALKEINKLKSCIQPSELDKIKEKLNL